MPRLWSVGRTLTTSDKPGRLDRNQAVSRAAAPWIQPPASCAASPASVFILAPRGSQSHVPFRDLQNPLTDLLYCHGRLGPTVRNNESDLAELRNSCGK